MKELGKSQIGVGLFDGVYIKSLSRDAHNFYSYKTSDPFPKTLSFKPFSGIIDSWVLNNQDPKLGVCLLKYLIFPKNID